MTGAEFRAARIERGITYSRAAGLAGVAIGSVRHWETMERVPEAAEQMLSAVTYTPDARVQLAYVVGRVAAVCEEIIGGHLVGRTLQALDHDPRNLLGKIMPAVHLPEHATAREKRSDLLSALMKCIPSNVPADLLTEEQSGSVWLGYYHQRGELHA